MASAFASEHKFGEGRRSLEKLKDVLCLVGR